MTWSIQERLFLTNRLRSAVSATRRHPLLQHPVSLLSPQFLGHRSLSCAAPDVQHTHDLRLRNQPLNRLSHNCPCQLPKPGLRGQLQPGWSPAKARIG